MGGTGVAKNRETGVAGVSGETGAGAANATSGSLESFGVLGESGTPVKQGRGAEPCHTSSDGPRGLMPICQSGLL